MHALTAAEMLDVWESGQGRDAPGRALLVLTAATGASATDLAHLSIARRDALLFDARRLAFGDELRAVVACPACAETLEFTTNVGAFTPDEPTSAEAVTIEAGALRATVRPPTTADLLAVRDAASVAAARDRLLARCVDALERDGHPVAFDLLDAAEVSALAAAASEAPALSDVLLELTCVACGSSWQSTFDVAAYLWEEVCAFASRLLPEVHVIAHAYGWSEREILGLSPARRARYLELIETGA